MKKIFTILAVALVAFSGIANAKPLPKAAKAELAAKLKGVDKTDSAAVNAAVLAAIAAFPSLAADITAAAVASLSASLSPAAAANVIPSLVAQVAKSYPADAGAITSASIGALPAEQKNALTPKIVTATVNAATTTQTKADILNGALAAVAGDKTLVTQLDGIAKSNGIKPSADGTGYVVQQTAEADDNSGATGPIQNSVPASGASGGSGGGSGTASGTQPSS